MIDFTVGKCKSKAGFSAKLKRPRKLDLSRIKKRFKVVLETPILVVIKVGGAGGVEVIVHEYGELLFKKEKALGVMEKAAEEIYGVGLGA